MKIKRKENYKIYLYQEPSIISDHSKKRIKDLEFTGLELIEAIVSAGMPDIYLTKTEKKNRREEIYFKTKLFETYVVSSTEGVLSFDTSKKKYLDSTEIGAINYWIGMVLITVLGMKKYNYDFMVHLSMVESFSSKICLKKRSFLSSTGIITFKSPDLLAINSSKNEYGIFEAKGYSNYNKKAMEHGYTQANSIKKINCKKPKNSLVVMTQTGTKEIKMIEKDPEGENCEINVNLDFLHIYHFLPIVELIMELNPEEREGYSYGSLIYENESYSIGVPSALYKELLPIVKDEKKTEISELIYKKIDSKEMYFFELISNKSKEKILCIE